MNTYKLRKCPICNTKYLSTDKYCPKCNVDTEQPYTITYYPTDNSTDSNSYYWTLSWNSKDR